MNEIISIIIVLSTIIICIGSFAKLIISYNKFNKLDNDSKLSGCEIVEKILEVNELENIYVVEIDGLLKDYYDSERKVIKLTTNNFHGTSLSSSIIATRISAYAIMDKKKNKIIRLRNTLLPLINIITAIGYLMLIVAIFLTNLRYLKLSLGVLFIIVLFHLLTIKTEIKATELTLKNLKKVNKKDAINGKELVENTTYLFLASIILFVVNFFGNLFLTNKKK